MGAQLDDPNREAVGLPPIWSTGAAKAKKAEPKAEPDEPKKADEHKAEHKAEPKK